MSGTRTYQWRGASALLCFLVLAACGDDGPGNGEDVSDAADATDTQSDAESDAPVDAPDDTEQDADIERDGSGDTTEDVEVDVEEPWVQPAPDDASRARAFRLYYKERVERALVAFNRYAVFGDATFAVGVNRAAVARDGDTYDIVVGPQDNNLIGTPVRAVYLAWKHLDSELAELTLRRLLRGMIFYEEITGVPGLTSRMALPGWTLHIDGATGAVTRTRDFGETEVTSPMPEDAELEAAIVEAFFDGGDWTYRMDPLDTLLRFLPAWDPADYAVTISIPNLPDFIRISDCCATLRRTPEGYTWENAWWSNHNSRDNYPDLAIGFLAALELSQNEEASEALRALAEDVVEAGERITDLVESNDGQVMTIDEYHEYGVLTVSGERRPHGLPENENLGGMSSCPMALLNRALSTDGLEAEPEGVVIPGSPEYLITPDIERLIECPYETPRVCPGVEEAWCGHTWETMPELRAFGQNWLDFARSMEANQPGSSGALLGAFQNDYDDVVEAMATLIAVLDAQGDEAQAARARETLGHMTDLMREFADIIYGLADPDEQAQQRYEAAVFDALGGIEVIVEDLNDFAIEDARIERAISALEIPAASPRPLLTDEEIATRIEEHLADLDDGPGPGRADAVRDRYADTYPDGVHPIRRAGDAYEARQGQGEWVPVENPRHVGVGGLAFLQALGICEASPWLLDCSWAALGCAAPDLDDSGEVDAADIALLEAAFETHGDGATCATEGSCDGADIDQSGTLDESDRVFMEVAQGCTR